MEKNRKIRRKWKMVVAIVFVLAVMIGIGLEGEERSVEGEPDVISSMIVNNEQYLTVVANRNEIEKEKEFKKLLIADKNIYVQCCDEIDRIEDNRQKTYFVFVNRIILLKYGKKRWKIWIKENLSNNMEYLLFLRCPDQ